MSDKNRGGRPTIDPKPNKLTVRVSDNTLEALDNYCQEKNLSRADGVRDGINRLKEKK